MDRDRYRRVATACMVLALVSVLAHQPTGEFRWIAVGMAVVAAVTASALYLYHHLNRRSTRQSLAADIGELVAASSPDVHPAKAVAERVALGLSDESRVLSDEPFRRELTRTVLELGKMLESLDAPAQTIHPTKDEKWQHVVEIRYFSINRSALMNQLPDVFNQNPYSQFYEAGETAKRKALRPIKMKSSETQGWISASMNLPTVDVPDWLGAGDGLRRAMKAEVG